MTICSLGGLSSIVSLLAHPSDGWEMGETLMDLVHRHISLNELRALLDSPFASACGADARFASVEVEAGLFLLAREMSVDAPFVFESESFPACTLSLVLDGVADRGGDDGAGCRRAEYDRLSEAHADADKFPDEVDARLGELEAMLEAFETRPLKFDPTEVARAGLIPARHGLRSDPGANPNTSALSIR